MPKNQRGGRLDAIDAVRAAGNQPQAEVVYFAHSLLDYGRPRAASALAAVVQHRGNAPTYVLNPGDWGRQDILAQWRSYQHFYRHVIRVSGCVYALEHLGCVGRGVFTEVRNALDAEIPVWVVRSAGPSQWSVQPVTDAVLVDPHDWALRYGLLHTPATVLAKATP